ncbi:Auxin-responsive protein SAUR32 [Forsythia ovata]|uniref:Auxin-responsive protein SAUR32 n=1 Tax=Forsythia ovata TaxID=205694 RepID=A0ABD1U9N4_9LAMI
MHRQGEKKMKLKKGCVAVQVGLQNGPFQRFVIPISYLHNPLFHRLLDRAHEFYGYHTNGPLMLPCSVEDFLHLQRRIERNASQQNRHCHHHHQHRNLFAALPY